MADRDKALEDYKAGLSYKEIAEKHDVSESTVKSWASRHWNNDKKIQTARRKSKQSQLKGKKGRNQKSAKKTQKDAPKPRGSSSGQYERCWQERRRTERQQKRSETRRLFCWKMG